MAYIEDHIALAAEYALGTLDADERALVETMLIVDPGFLALVHAWEHKLAPLHQMVSSVEPPSDVWDRIKASIAQAEEQAAASANNASEDKPVHAIDPVTLEMTSALDASSAPDANATVSPELTVTPPESESTGQGASVAAATTKPSPAKGSGIFGIVMSAVAAVLAGIVALQIYRPAALPLLCE